MKISYRDGTVEKLCYVPNSRRERTILDTLRQKRLADGQILTPLKIRLLRKNWMTNA